jgi:hypothetical protein
MRKPEVIQEQIRHLDKIMMTTRMAVEDSPHHYGLKLMLDQDEYSKLELVQELQESFIAHRNHVLSYIFKILPGEGMELDPLLSGLTAFRDLVTKASLIVCSRDLPLRFGTIFQSSFGVMLTTPPDAGLISTDYDHTFAKVFSVIEELSADDVDLAKVLEKTIGNNKGFAKKFSNLFADVTESQRDVVISWCNIHGDKKSIDITAEKAKWMRDAVLTHDKKKSDTLELVGTIKGMSLVSNKIEFEYRKGNQKKLPILRASFPPDMFSLVSSNFNKKTTATFNIEFVYDDETEEESKIITLLSIY